MIHLPFDMHNWLALKVLHLAIKNRETCDHFIDYEILDALSLDELKEKYMLQCANFEVILRPATEEREAIIEIRCFEKRFHHRENCSKCYEKTIEALKDEMKNP